MTEPKDPPKKTSRRQSGTVKLELVKAQKTLGARIKFLRERVGLSPTDAALACDVSRSHWYEIEAGDVNLEMGSLVKIAEGLKVHISELFPKEET